ncbi:MAG TPA: hypothetical protein VFR58_09090 [Flavisolibacter sp.]|nr:hypothetical protein [Flavisolibacter sp.]
MKKGIAFLLVLITLAASVFPCCPSDGCADDAGYTAPAGTCNDDGACSPFFACSTCPGFVSLTRIPRLPAPLSALPVHFQARTAVLANLFYPSFFQPPRVAIA